MIETKENIKVINEIKNILDFFSQNQVFSNLIPEVRTNISGALDNAKSIMDVAGIDGRITIIDGYPKACGKIKFGASNHTARLVLTAKEFDKSINFVMNLRYLPNLINSLQEKTPFGIFKFERVTQPENIEKREDSTMQWLIKESIHDTGKIPDIIWDTGAIGKEPMMRVFAKDSEDMINKLGEIIKLI